MAHIDAPERAALVQDKWTVFWVSAVVAFVILLIVGAINFTSRTSGGGVATTYPLCAETEVGVRLTVEKPEAKLPLNPNCWSGWVRLPANVDFFVDTSKDHEYLFWNGERKFVSSKNPKWLGQINGNIFRLRGEGIVPITIEPKRGGAPKLAAR